MNRSHPRAPHRHVAPRGPERDDGAASPGRRSDGAEVRALVVRVGRATSTPPPMTREEADFAAFLDALAGEGSG
ncbi:hypothetical protein L6R52_24985 [Myxococcota bacterium]|nr:hypothetical protein [Myxococcota bacterium]